MYKKETPPASGAHKGSVNGYEGNGSERTGNGFDPSNFTFVDDIAGEVNDTDASDGFDENVFIATWANKPPIRKPVLELNDVTFLTYQNICGLIAAPGLGKTSLIERLVANYLNPQCDSLGFKVSEECGGILIADMERPDDDVWGSFHRSVCKFAGLDYGKKIEKNIVFAGMRGVSSASERKKVILELVKKHKPSLLLIDGAGDLVDDINNTQQTAECVSFLRATTKTHKLSILTTIHPNPNSNNPRGHVGAAIWRECESALLAKKINDHLRIITTDFDFGKNRHNTHVNAAYQWNDETKMFVSADPDSIAEAKGQSREARERNDAELLQLKVIPAPKALTRSDLEKEIMELEGCKETTADRRVKAMLKFLLIKKHDDGRYRAV